jgi:hypothetical protein
LILYYLTTFLSWIEEIRNMYYNKKCFNLFFIISSICIGLTIILLEDSSKGLAFRVFAMDDNSFFTLSFPLSSRLEDQQKSEGIGDKSSKFIQIAEEKDECPPKPTSLETDPRTSESLQSDAEPPPRIQIKAPTLANIGSSILIEGTGYIPLEQVRVELAVDWIFSSPEFKGETFYECKIVVANSLGSFETTLKLPEMPLDVTGNGKYSIIGMESRQEKTRLGFFLTSNIGFSFRQ